MKVALEPASGNRPYPTLKLEGPLSAHTIQVLRAGVSKLLRDGKNRLVIHLLNANDFDSSALQALGQFNALARELAGEITLSGLEASQRQLVDSFGKPAAIRSFATLEEAMSYLAKPTAAQTPTPAPPASQAAVTRPAPSDGSSAPAGAAKNELATLRQENERLKRENAALHAHLLHEEALQRVRVSGADAQAKLTHLEGQVSALSQEVVKLNEQIQKSAKAKP